MSGPEGTAPSRTLTLTRQMELGDCGAACLAMVLRAYGRPAPLAELRDRSGTGRDGVSALGIVHAARHHGFEAVGVRCPSDRLDDLPAGAILHWGDNHFVVLVGRGRRGLRILDPALGRRTVSPQVVQEQYSGVALLLTPPAGGPPARQRGSLRRARTARYRPFAVGVGRPLGAAVALAAVVQACALVYPLVLRTVVEQVGVDAARASTAALFALVAALAVGYLLALVGRVLCLAAVQRSVDVRLTLGVLSHLARLPFAFVARRSTGDLALRVRSTFAVRQILTSSALSALLDGTLVLGYLVVILVIDPPFAALTLASVLVQVALVALTWRYLRETAAEALDRQTTAQSGLLELVSGFEILKATGSAQRAVDDWSLRLQAEVDAQVRNGRASGLVDGVLATLRFATPPALLILGLSRVADGSLDLAEMLALAALAVAVTVPVGALLGTVCALTSVFGYLDRLDDLLQTPPESNGARRPPEVLDGDVRLDGVAFRYSPLSAPALQDVQLHLGAGEHVAVVGASGSGKSTLALLIATLYDPTDGAVRVDGVPVTAYDRDALRSRIGVVTQKATLFNATVRDNIALGRSWITDEDVVEAARAAALHEDVARLPSGYATRLGNAGSGLSGGQLQRIGLARALAGRPGLLVLDEATSALDPVTERAVHEALAELDCTLVVVAHRLSAVATADRVLVMDQGRLVDDGTYTALRRRSRAFRALLEGDGRLPRRGSAAER